MLHYESDEATDRKAQPVWEYLYIAAAARPVDVQDWWPAGHATIVLSVLSCQWQSEAELQRQTTSTGRLSWTAPSTAAVLPTLC